MEPLCERGFGVTSCILSSGPSLSQERIHGVTVNPLSHVSLPWKPSKTGTSLNSDSALLTLKDFNLKSSQCNILLSIWYLSSIHMQQQIAYQPL